MFRRLTRATPTTPMAAPIPAALHEVEKPSAAPSKPIARPTTSPTAIRIAMICHQGIGPPEFATARA